MDAISNILEETLFSDRTTNNYSSSFSIGEKLIEVIRTFKVNCGWNVRRTNQPFHRCCMSGKTQRRREITPAERQ